MIIVKIMGGLGNQMSQYAFYLKQCTVHENVKIDKITFYHRFAKKYHSGYELGRIFQLEENSATFKEIRKLSRYRNVRLGIISSEIQRILYERKSKRNESMNLTQNQPASTKTNHKEATERLSGKDRVKHFVKNLIYKDDTKHFVQTGNTFYGQYLENTDIYYEGTWMDIEYYGDIMDTIHSAFTFKNEPDKRNKDTLSLIEATCSVSIHVRRGDYLLHTAMLNCPSVEYYKNAVNLIEERLQCKPAYFIFSDDIEWVKENYKFLKDKTCYFVDWNSGEKSYMDMQLMSNCKHNIITNSSFSWWASLLNRSESKIVISPESYYTADYKAKTGIKDDNLLKYPKNVTHFRVKD